MADERGFLIHLEDVNTDKVVEQVYSPKVAHDPKGDPGSKAYAEMTGGSTSLAPDPKLMHNFHSSLGQKAEGKPLGASLPKPESGGKPKKLGPFGPPGGPHTPGAKKKKPRALGWDALYTDYEID